MWNCLMLQEAETLRESHLSGQRSHKKGPMVAKGCGGNLSDEKAKYFYKGRVQRVGNYNGLDIDS